MVYILQFYYNMLSLKILHILHYCKICVYSGVKMKNFKNKLKNVITNHSRKVIIAHDYFF